MLVLLVAFSVYSLTNSDPLVMVGDNVTIEYVGSISDHVFNTNIVNFTVGQEQVIRGIDNGVLGMRLGEIKNITVPPELGFGAYDEMIVYEVPFELFETHNQSLPAVGQEVDLNNALGVVIGYTNDSIVIDTNHPLAGETINLSLKVLSIN